MWGSSPLDNWYHSLGDHDRSTNLDEPANWDRLYFPIAESMPIDDLSCVGTTGVADRRVLYGP